LATGKETGTQDAPLEALRIRWSKNTVRGFGHGPRVPSRDAARRGAYLFFGFWLFQTGLGVWIFVGSRYPGDWRQFVLFVGVAAAYFYIGRRILAGLHKIPIAWAVSEHGLHLDFGGRQDTYPYVEIASFDWALGLRHRWHAKITLKDGSMRILPSLSPDPLENMEAAVRRRRPATEGEILADFPP
jgi:hypothetical protein